MTLAQSLRHLDQLAAHTRLVRPREPGLPSFQMAMWFRVEALRLGIRWPDDPEAQKRLRFDIRARNDGRSLMSIARRDAVTYDRPVDLQRINAHLQAWQR